MGNLFTNTGCSRASFHSNAEVCRIDDWISVNEM